MNFEAAFFFPFSHAGRRFIQISDDFLFLSFRIRGCLAALHHWVWEDRTDQMILEGWEALVWHFRVAEGGIFEHLLETPCVDFCVALRCMRADGF
jgi:hypothetical protein